MTIPGSPDAAASHNIVFIDTSLDTHLAMAISDGDTVSDVKEKIEKEHPLCFSHLGNIKIHALKVQRKGHLYHLSDSMYLKSAFFGVDDSWFLSIDASVADGHDPNTGSLSTYLRRADNTSIDGSNLARNNHRGQIPNHEVPSLPDNAVQQYVNEKTPTDIYFGSRHSNKKDLMIKKTDVTHSVENCSKDQPSRTMNGCEGLNRTLETLLAVKVNQKSKKRKKKLVNEHEVVNHTSDDNDQNPLQQVVRFCEKSGDYAHNEVSNLPMMESKSSADEPDHISSSNTHDGSEHEMKRKYNLAENIDVDGRNDKSKKAIHLMDNSTSEVAAQVGSIVKKLHKIEMMSGVVNGEGNEDLVSDSSKATSTPKVTSEYLSDNKQTAKVALGSLSTEPGACLLKTGSSDVKKKKKRKNKLSDCPNQAVGLISSRVGDQQDASRESDITTVPSQDIEAASIPDCLGTSVRESQNDSIRKTAENFASSLIGESCGGKNMELGDVQSIRDVSDEAALGVKRITDSNDLAFKSNDPTGFQKSICTSEDANNVQSNHLMCKTGQIVAIPEEKDSMQNTDTKATMVENCRSSIWDGSDTNVKATHISEIAHLKGTAENTKCSKKKKTKKSKDLVEGRRINLVTTGARDSACDIPPTELHSITLGDNSSSKAEMVESDVSVMKVENTTSTSTLLTVRNIDIDGPNISKMELSQQINKTEAGAENVDGQVRKKIKKRSATSVKSMLQAENIGNEDSLLSLHSITLGDNSSSKAEMVESIVSLMKGENTTSASILPTVRNIDIDGANISKAETSQKTNKIEAGSENVDGQVRKKIKKRPATSVKSTSYLQAVNIGNEGSLLSKRSNGEVKSVSIAVKETKLPRNEIEEAKLDSTLFSEVESSPRSICKKSRIVGSSQTRSQVSEGNHEGRSLDANICSNGAEDGTANNVDNRAEVPSESDKVGIEESAGRLQDESIKFHSDKLSREKSANTLLKAKRKKKDPNACSSGASLSMQNIQKSDENTETGRQCQTSNSSSLKFDGSPSKDKCDVKLHCDNKAKKKSRGGVKIKSLPSKERKQQMSDVKKAATVRKNTVNSSWDSTEKNSETSAVPRTRSSLKNSARMVYQEQKHMGHQSGHPVGGRKSSQNGNKDATRSERRNLLATSGGIFKDASSDSSEDEGGVADSDVSTRSPDDSLSSDFSDGESNASVDFTERENIRRRSIRKKDSSPDDMALDAILRSSSRYKKAKLTADQLQQDDTESQPVDFVPDSRANL